MPAEIFLFFLFVNLYYYYHAASSDAMRQDNRNLTLNLASQIMAEHQGEVNFKGKEGSGALQSIEICLPLFWHEADSLRKIVPT
ncbi:MAG: hypothetical protein MUO63_14620 [Desulfobulbaceae bacterium]|nr:hypothetical protein [Desulfobulbaceae bacterium]